MPKGGRVAATPDCPQFQGNLPDRFGDYGTLGLNTQTSTHQEKAGPHALPHKPPLVYRPPVNQWSPQTGMGSPEMRFTERKYEKGSDVRPPVFRVKGSSPLKKGSSYPRAHDCTKYPGWEADPQELQLKYEREKAAKDRALIEKPFKPAGSGPTAAFGHRYTSSIMFHKRR